MSPHVPLDRVAVIGLGYIGLPTAVVLAQSGKTVIGVDVKQSSVDAINAGEAPFVEEGLQTVLAGVVAQGNLSAQLTIPEADAYIIAVPTPFKNNHDADLSHIEAAAQRVAKVLTGRELIIVESTAPPGTTEHVAKVVLEARPEFTDEPNLENSLYFSHAPERVLPGRIMVELIENDRIIGGTTKEAAELNSALYTSFCRGELMLTDAKTAEMAKLTENAYRDVNIAFANELSIIAQRQGINIWELIELANHHPRVDILQPGPGVGGHCIAVDPWFIVSADREHSKLIKTARQVNDSKPQFVLETVLRHAERHANPTIAALGITYKANVDDLRESPAKAIVAALSDTLTRGTILVVEPNISSLPPEIAKYSNTQLVGIEDAVRRSDIVLALVEHNDFKRFGDEDLHKKTVIDTKGIWR